MWNTLKRIGVWVSQLFEPTLWELRIFAAEHALNNAVAEVAELRAELAQAEIELADKAFYVREFAAVSAERDALRERASVPVPEGLPTADELAKIGADAWNACAGERHLGVRDRARATAIRDAVLAGVAADQPADQVEALARVLQCAYSDECGGKKHFEDWPAGVRDGFRAEARAAIAHLAKRPEGLPTAEELAKQAHEIMLQKYPTDYYIPYVDCDSKVIVSRERFSDTILAALRPWLRDPVGFELDVTIDAAMKAYLDECMANSGRMAECRGDGISGVLDLCRSRIRPVFECKECAKLRDDVTFWKRENVASNNKMLAARAALEVDSNKIETAYGTLRCSLEHQQKLHAAALEIAMAEPKENE